MRVCIVLPTIDEGPLLEETARAAFAALAREEVRLLIAASAKLTTLRTRDAIQKLEREYPGKVSAFDQRLPGVGAAIQEAFARAEGDVVVLMTPDLETPPEVLPQMIKKIEDGYDMAAATRWRKGFAFNGYDPIKLVLNFCFQQMFRIVYLTTLSDLTYGYRAFRINVVKSIRWEEARHPFFFETILKPLRLGYTIAEVDAPWEMFISRKSSTGRAKPKDLLAYLKTGFRNRFLSKRKMYRI